MSTHDQNGPSTLERRAACPGSRAAEQAATDERSEASNRGDRLHAIIAGLVRKQPHEQLAALGALPADELAIVEGCMEEANRCESAALKHLGDSGESPIVLTEYHVDLAHLGIPKGGTVDLAVVIPGQRAWVRDWKTGDMWQTPARWNRQLQAYASGIAEAFGCSEVDAAIVQPTAGEPRAHVFDAPALAAINEDLVGVVRRAMEANAPQVPGDHCVMCRAKATCAKRAEVAGTVATIRDPVAVMLAAAPGLRAGMFEQLQLARSVIGNALDVIEGAALAGTLPMPGYKIGRGKKSRAWANEAAAEQALRRLVEAKGLSPDTLAKRELISPAEAEKLLGKSKAILAEVGPLIEEKEGREKLVRDFVTVTA